MIGRHLQNRSEFHTAFGIAWHGKDAAPHAFQKRQTFFAQSS
jgi:hypothetical protein